MICKEVEYVYEVIVVVEEVEFCGLGVVLFNGKMIDGLIIDYVCKVVVLLVFGICD